MVRRQSADGVPHSSGRARDFPPFRLESADRRRRRHGRRRRDSWLRVRAARCGPDAGRAPDLRVALGLRRAARRVHHRSASQRDGRRSTTFIEPCRSSRRRGPTSCSSAATTSPTAIVASPAPCAEALGVLTAPLGVFAVLGNHDDDRVVPAALKAQRIAVLRDEWTTISRGGASFVLAGVRFWTRTAPEIARVLAGAHAGPCSSQLTIRDGCRKPRRSTSVACSRDTRMAGQVVLPMIGALAARKFPIAAGPRQRARTRKCSSAAASARSFCRCGSTALPKWRSSRCAREASSDDVASSRTRRPHASRLRLRWRRRLCRLVVYASLVPLDEHPLSAREAWALLAASWPPAITSKTDFVANLILQFPFGFLLTGALARDRGAASGAGRAAGDDRPRQRWRSPSSSPRACFLRAHHRRPTCVAETIGALRGRAGRGRGRATG